MSECNSAKTPMEVQIKLKKEGKGAIVDSTNLISLIEGLRYVIH